jgi:tripartite-type tricarboxylate transporter receptor subunit TctC
MQRTLRFCICTLLVAGAANAHAQTAGKAATTYPTKPIRIVVTYPPGGPTDIVARAIGQKMTETWSQPVVIDNRAGAGGIVGTEVVARAAPDGYTLLLGTSAGLSINPALNPKLPYNAFSDFAPISLVVINPQILVFNGSFAPSSLKELIQLAKARPGQINFASVGPGSPNHLGMELLKSMAGIDMVHIPYKGTSPAVTDLLTGQVSLMFNSMPSVLQQVRAGKLKGIAVGSAKRSQAAPEIPTVSEAGLPGFEYVTWYGLFAPAATPKDIVATLNKEIVRMLADPQLAQRFASQGAEPASTAPAELAKFMRAEHERWKQVIKSGRIRIDG